MERHWNGIPRPWDRFIGKTFGKYTLTSYHNLPNDDPSNIPPVYEFTLIDSNFKNIKIEACNILQLENWVIEKESPYFVSKLPYILSRGPSHYNLLKIVVHVPYKQNPKCIPLFLFQG